MFHNDSCCLSNKTCRVDDRAQKSWLDKLQQRHLPNWPLRVKNRALAQSGKHGPAMTKLHNNAAWHRRARFQLQREPLCAMCLAEGKVVAARIADRIEPRHNDPIRFWNGKLQSLCARIATRAGRFRGEPRWLADRFTAFGLSVSLTPGG